MPGLLFFFFNDTATTEIYTLSLHDALPISCRPASPGRLLPVCLSDAGSGSPGGRGAEGDRKSTRLNSSHGYISYAVFCLKKKKTSNTDYRPDSTRLVINVRHATAMTHTPIT